MIRGRKKLPEDAPDAPDSTPAGAGRVLDSLAAVVIAAFARVSTGATPWPRIDAAFAAGELGKTETGKHERGCCKDD